MEERWPQRVEDFWKVDQPVFEKKTRFDLKSNFLVCPKKIVFRAISLKVELKKENDSQLSLFPFLIFLPVFSKKNFFHQSFAEKATIFLNVLNGLATDSLNFGGFCSFSDKACLGLSFNAAPQRILNKVLTFITRVSSN